MASGAHHGARSGPFGCSVRAQVVLYRESLSDVWRMLRGLSATARTARANGRVGWVELFLGDCSPTRILREADEAEIDEHLTAGGVDRVHYVFFDANLKSARGNNTLAANAGTDFLLILNPDTYAAPTMLTELVAAMADPRVGIAEARQIPVEHPKAFDLRTGDTSWASGCGYLARRKEAFEAVGGYDADHFPLYCDDVDLSWRVRLAGMRVVHVPKAVLFHDKQIGAEGHVASSSVEVYEGTLARLMLGVKYGRPDIVDETVTWIETSGLEGQAEALEEFRRRLREGSVPAPVGSAHRAAQFVNGEYAVHRF